MLINFQQYLNKDPESTGFDPNNWSFNPNEFLKEDWLWMWRAYEFINLITRLYKEEIINNLIASKILNSNFELVSFMTKNWYDASLVNNDKISELKAGGIIYIYSTGEIAGYNRFIHHRMNNLFECYRWTMLKDTELPKCEENNHWAMPLLTNLKYLIPKNDQKKTINKILKSANLPLFSNFEFKISKSCSSNK